MCHAWGPMFEMPSDSHTPSSKADLDAILVTEAIRSLRELEQKYRHYQGRELAVIAITNGAVIFVADLIRQMELPVLLDCIRVSSYREETDQAMEPKSLIASAST